MNEADLERYIKAKSNGRNIVAICIINLLLFDEIASRSRLWQDVLVYVRKNYTNLPSSYDNPMMRRNLRRLQKRFDGAMSSFFFQVSEKPRVILTEISRSLKKGGWLALIEWHREFELYGPPTRNRISPDKCRSMAEKAGFNFYMRHDLSDMAYMLLLRK